MSRSALHYPAAEADDGAVARNLDHGADPNSADANEWTPLHFAAQNHSLSSIHLLLDSGALIDAQDRHGNTAALWVAVMNLRGRGETVRALLDHGANPDLANKSGVSARALASRIANYDISRYFG
jgi:uncharacterized protein